MLPLFLKLGDLALKKNKIKLNKFKDPTGCIQ